MDIAKEKPFNDTEVSEVNEGELTASVDPLSVEFIAEQLGTPPNNDDGTYSLDVLFMAEKFVQMTDEQAYEICSKALEYHEHDPNMRNTDKDLLQELVENYASGEKSDSSLLRYWGTLIHWWSPYPEVRAVTDPFDDDTQTVLTWRVVFLGTIWVGIASFVNAFFEPRQPPIAISSNVCQLLLYPSGLLLQYCLPDWGFTIRGKRFTLNPGKWSQKEQLLATVMVSCASATPYVIETTFVQYMPMFYNQSWAGSFGYSFLLTLVTQFMGFGLAGLLRRVAVYPVMSMWPTQLPTLAVNKALLARTRKESINGWTISRYTFFFAVFVFAFFYFWIPNYLFGALSNFNWMTWIAPNNANLAIITGSVGGLGYNPIPTFDWNVMNSLIMPLNQPLITSVNYFVGMFLSGFVIMAIYFTNNNYTRWLPINDNRLYDNTGGHFKVDKILTNYMFDEEKYKKYSPPYYCASQLVTYGAFFCMYPMLFVYAWLCYYKPMWLALKDTWKALKNIHRSNYEGLDDSFSRIQKKYKEVPDWWFYSILVIMFALSIVLVEHWPTDTPVWVIVLCLGMCLVFLLPFTIFLSLTGVQFALNVLGELITGYALPGRYQAINNTKAFIVQISIQAQSYSGDQKLTHYAHLPPRSIFGIQLWATLVNALVSLGVLQFQMHSVKDICTPDNIMKFTCPGENTLFSSSIIWGVIGPKRIFDHQYPVLKWMFLLGAGLGVVFWAIQFGIPALLIKKYPSMSKKVIKYQRVVSSIQPVVVVNSFSLWAPYNVTYVTGGLYLALLFNGYIKSRYLAWWRKYTYIFSAAMGTGVALSGIVIFFAVQYNDYELNWWGNNVSYAGLDAAGVPTPPLPSVGYFGPGPDHYP